MALGEVTYDRRIMERFGISVCTAEDLGCRCDYERLSFQVPLHAAPPCTPRRITEPRARRARSWIASSLPPTARTGCSPCTATRCSGAPLPHPSFLDPDRAAIHLHPACGRSQARSSSCKACEHTRYPDPPAPACHCIGPSRRSPAIRDAARARGRLGYTLITAYAMRHRLFDCSADAVAWLRLARPDPRPMAVPHAVLRQHALQAPPRPAPSAQACPDSLSYRDPDGGGAG